jgi:alanine dehydrogenase
MNLIRSDGLIGAVSHPGAHGAPKTLFLELSDYPLHAAVLLDQTIDHGDHFGTHRSPQQSVEHSHVELLLVENR